LCAVVVVVAAAAAAAAAVVVVCRNLFLRQANQTPQAGTRMPHVANKLVLLALMLLCNSMQM
jgi:hypothetical protein